MKQLAHVNSAMLKNIHICIAKIIQVSSQQWGSVIALVVYMT